MTLKHIIFIMFMLIFMGLMVLIGILVYQNQIYKSNQQALEIDMSRYSSLVFGYWKTPYFGGGAGQNTALVKKEKLAEFLGFSHVIEPANKASYYSVFTMNGEIRLMQVGANSITLKGVGRVAKKGSYPVVQNSINLYTFMINSNVGTAAGF